MRTTTPSPEPAPDPPAPDPSTTDQPVDLGSGWTAPPPEQPHSWDQPPRQPLSVSVIVPRQTLRSVASRGLRFTVDCTARSSQSVTLRLTPAARKMLARKRSLTAELQLEARSVAEVVTTSQRLKLTR
jgi:hypothetical protein